MGEGSTGNSAGMVLGEGAGMSTGIRTGCREGGTQGRVLADPSSRRSLLRQLQTLIKQTSNKAAQTSTCVLVGHTYHGAPGTPVSPSTTRGYVVSVPSRQILLLSLGLILFPSYSPFRWGLGGSRDGDRPTGGNREAAGVPGGNQLQLSPPNAAYHGVSLFPQ